MHGLLIILFGGCAALSFFLSGMEAGVFALSRLRIRHLMRSGNSRARALHDYLERPENFLWTILVGNTLSNLGAVSIGVIWLHGRLWHWPWLLFIALVVGILIFYAVCELLPKMIFRLYPNRLCMALAGPFRLAHFALRPLVAPVAWLSRWLLVWTGGRRFTGHLFGSRDELRMVMQESAQGLSGEERVMINRVLDLQNVAVQQVTIPLATAVTLSAEATVGELFAVGREKSFSRYPVWKTEAGRRRVVGLVNLRSLLSDGRLDENRTVGEFLRPALYLDDNTRLEVALRQMQRSGHRLAIVLGRDRREIGIVCLQDILRMIFGEVRL